MYFGKFSSVKISDFQVSGHLERFLETQRDGLGGHYDLMGFPFNTPMWDGGVGRVETQDIIYRAEIKELPPDETWWPYEQSAYLLDGLLKLGFLLKEQRFVELFQRNMNYLLGHPDEQGILGFCYNRNRSQWPMIVMTRALIAYYKVTEDQRILDALHRHFLAIPDEELYNDLRHINMLEGMLAVYGLTGEKALLDRAVWAYGAHDRYCAEKLQEEEMELRWGKLTSGRNFAMHGVSFSESVKLPVLLFMHTGERRYLDKAEEALADVLQRHEQIPGIVSSDEFLSGRDPLQGYESCLLTDFTWALGYFLMATGKAEYADRIEKIIYNALPGAISKDFTSLQYFSAPNQVTATPQSTNTHFFYMRSPMRQYRVSHFPQCCPGNIQKAMPNFVARMFMKDGEGAPVATLYGPVSFHDSFQGQDYEIVEETGYPYEEHIRFVFHLAQKLQMPFTLRIPQWCAGATISVNGQPVNAEGTDGFVRLERQWCDGDAVELRLPMAVRQVRDRQWSHFEYGPLVFSYPVPTETIKETDNGRFSSLILNPSGAWNYGIVPGTKATVRRVGPVDNPLTDPPLALDVEAVPVSGYDELVDERFTPSVPLFCHPIGKPETLTLVPMAATMLRVTAFPDVVKRIPIHLYDVSYWPRTYPYDARKPLPEQSFLPERLTVEEFRQKSRRALMQPGLYCDLMKNLGRRQETMAYVLFRFYSDFAGKATFAVSASDAAVGYCQGRQFCEIQGVSEAEFMEPQWFELSIQPGWTELLFKVAETDSPDQYYDSWGIRVKAFHE